MHDPSHRAGHHHGHWHPGNGHQGHGHHGHHHHHGHHAPGHGAPQGRAFAIAVGLNLGFVLVEVAAGLVYNSMALLADAGHNFADGLALLLAWGASVLTARAPSARFTYGLRGSSILAGLINAAMLWVALGAILLETVQRLFHPAPVAAHLTGRVMMVVAAAGIAINGAAAMLFARGRKDDINLRAAFQHLLADALVSAGVVVVGGLVLATQATWIDPAASLLIIALIGWSSWGLLRESVALGLAGVPAGIDERAVRGFLAAAPGVSAVHDLHIWPMSTTETALTAHLVMPGGAPGDAFLHGLAAEMARRWRIGHTTIQVECAGEACALHPEGVV